MKHLLRFLVAVERVVTSIFGFATALVLFCLMVLTCVDVTGRYFFNHPVYGGFELTGILLGLTIFFALPLASQAGDNVTIDLLTLRNRRMRIIQHAVIHVIGAVVMVVLATQLWNFGNRLMAAGETTLQLKIPIGYVTYAMSILLALSAVAFIAKMFRPDSGLND